MSFRVPSVLALIVVSLAMGATNASATTPSTCPAAPADYSPASPPTDTDTVAGAIVVLQREVAQSCAVAHSDSVAEQADADANSTAIVTAVNGTTGATGPTTVVRLDTSAPLPDQYVNSYDGIRTILYIIAGLMATLIMSPYIKRAFRI